MTRLRREAIRYRERYGDIDELAPLDRLDSSISARRSRLDQLEEMAAEIAAERAAVEAEVAGIERGIEAWLGEVLPAIGDKFGEGWSPTPVLGYRLWAWNDGRMHGVRTHWAQPHLTAVCETARDRVEIPHSDGRCGRLGCGIYAGKRLERLLDEFAPALRSSFAAGLVALSGKVVEHDHGYRGAEARVVAVAAVAAMQAEFTAEPDRIGALFGGAPISSEAPHFTERSQLLGAVLTYLCDQERSRSRWISANSDA